MADPKDDSTGDPKKNEMSYRELRMSIRCLTNSLLLFTSQVFIDTTLQSDSFFFGFNTLLFIILGHVNQYSLIYPDVRISSWAYCICK